MKTNNTLDTRELMTGKDGMLFVEFDGTNIPFVECGGFSVNMDVSAVDKQPLGSILINSVPSGVAFTLTLTEMVVRDDIVMEPLLEAISRGWLPVYNFQGVTYKPDGQEQRVTYNHAVPKGTFGLQNVTPGEVIEREQNYALNSIPQFLKSLASTYIK